MNQNQYVAGMQQAADSARERSRLSRISETLSTLNADLAGIKTILADAHVAMIGHSGVNQGVPGSLPPQPGIAAVPGLFTDIENYMAGTAAQLEETRRLADQIHELVRR